jgi:hypothetical protein
MQAWYRPPLPKASPEPANVTVTDAAPEELTGTFWRVAGSPAWTGAARTEGRARVVLPR